MVYNVGTKEREVNEMKTPRNLRTATVKMSRGQLCDLLIACTVSNANAKQNAGERGESIDRTKWDDLHDLLKGQLDALDKKLDEEGE